MPIITLKTIDFNFNTTGFPTLRDLIIAGDGEQKKYSFKYTTTTGDTYIFSKSLDHWGYANGKQNPTLIPKLPIIDMLESQNAFSPTTNYDPFQQWADRSYSFVNAQALALSEITYPTGGKSIIEYESAGGRGIRVKSEKDIDIYGAPEVSKFYKYFPDNPVPDPFYNSSNYSTQEIPICHDNSGNLEWTNQQFLTLTSSSISGLSQFMETQNYYDHVVEYLGSATGSFGRNEYKFIRDEGSRQVFPTEQSSYDASGVLLKKSVNVYETTLLRTVHFWSDPQMLQPPISSTCTQYATLQFCDAADPLFTFALARVDNISLLKTQTKINWIKLKETQETNYSATNPGSLSQLTKNYYLNAVSPATAPKYSMPHTTEQYLSNGDIIKLRTYYPGDVYIEGMNTVILGPNQMWVASDPNFKSMLSYPVIKVKSLNGVEKGKVKYTYSYNSGTDEVNLTQSQSFVNNELVAMLNLNYVKGDRVKQIEENQQNQSYIRDYNQQFITAKVSNSISTSCAYTGFEGSYTGLGVADENKGNWDFDKNLIVTSTPLSGKKALALAPGVSKIESLYGLESGKKYTVTFWTWGGGCQVKNGTTILTPTNSIKSVDGGWNLNSYTLTGNGSKISIATGPSATSTIYFDEVRLLPENASMEAFSYDAAGNITSRCDNRNVLFYYLYDSFGRLEYVKDEMGNIIEKSEYKIQQP